jgi:hypothetical protein
MRKGEDERIVARGGGESYKCYVVCFDVLRQFKYVKVHYVGHRIHLIYVNAKVLY